MQKFKIVDVQRDEVGESRLILSLEGAEPVTVGMEWANANAPVAGGTYVVDEAGASYEAPAPEPVSTGGEHA